MKRSEKISIKWKIFLYLLGFTAVLLVILWLMQIIYLDTFYKMIKTGEAEQITSEAISVLQSEDSNQNSELDMLAASKGMSIYVTDIQGNPLSSAEYIPTSRLNAIPAEMVLFYYQQALENGGTAKIEFQGNVNKTFSEGFGNQIFSENNNQLEGQYPNGDEQRTFFQNHGQERIESVIYVNIVNVNDQDLILMVNAQLTPVDATVATLRRELLWITGIMIILSLLIALLISRQVSKSFIQINDAAKRMAKGDFDVRFEGRDYREVAELSDTLTATAEELGKSEALQRELIANVSHDLRTPLTMIIAYSEVMRDLPGENTPENVQIVIDESRRLTNLVNDMLDISKLGAGVMEKNATVYCLTNSIQSVLERYNKLKEQDGYTIEFFFDETVLVEADEYKMFQVIYNLVNNAINYAGEDKTVCVRQIIQGRKVRIEVEDHGAGIAKKDLPYVWNRYYKVDKTHKRAVMGTGLGLAIVKKILELHQAVYGVESVESKGSTFWFELEIHQNT